MALSNEHDVGPATAPAGMALGEGPQPGSEMAVRVRLARLVTLGRAALADDLGRPPPREAEPFLEHLHGAVGRAYQFPRAISRSARFWGSLAATSA